MCKKVYIAMSGGVDSSVAAMLIVKEGFKAEGITLKLYENEDVGEDILRPCCSIEDAKDAEMVCDTLGIPFKILNRSEKFQKKVMDNFVEEYVNGRTPNPCLECNRFLKFTELLDEANKNGVDYIATGHYAIIKKDKDTGKFRMFKGKDPTKDQSYVLYMLTQKELSRLKLPLGEYTKKEIRQLADKMNFVNANKPDSQDICFVRDGDYVNFIKQYANIDPIPGDFLNTDGNKIGEHTGIINYTIGQRRGLGIAYKEPLYVVDKSKNNNTVTLGTKSELKRYNVFVENVNWISGEVPTKELLLNVKIRYRHPEAKATVYPLPENMAKIVFEEPQTGIAPGQSAVFYHDDEVIGGGIILGSN